MVDIICHTASLYFMYEKNYESTLEERIEQCIEAGCNGVEISNGPEGLLNWNPSSKIRKLLKDKVVTIHAELDNNKAICLPVLARKLAGLNLDIRNVTFHPDELSQADWMNLVAFPFPLSIENMDRNRTNWRTAKEIVAVKPEFVGFTMDVAHSAEHGFGNDEFRELFIPDEIHLSYPTTEYHHTLIHKADIHPFVPSGSPLLTIEGIVKRYDDLVDEVRYIGDYYKW